DFAGDGKTDVLFYYSGDGHIFVGASTGTALNWHQAGDASGFGNLLDGSHTLYSGDYNGDGKRDLAFYYNGDGHWFMGLSDGTNLAWHQASDSSGFGNLADGSHRLLSGDFNGDGK